MRSGLWMTGSGGSGILIARKSDGTWSPPSGIMLHTPTLSFIIGVDIYDCVLVVSNLAALETITRPRVTLGEDVSLINGPSVPLDSDEKRISWKDLDNTVLAYMKARGQHQSVNLNGCILTERANENERFYNGDVTQMDVLAGNVTRHVEETKPLFEVIKMAEGRTDFDSAVIDKTAVLPAPGDAVIETPKSTDPASPRFGHPKADDPDPFGILALEMAGLEIREAGSRLRPTSSQVDFGANPMSPTLSKFSRQSIESMARSNRGSYVSTRTIKSQVTDVATQTDTRSNSPSPRHSDERSDRQSIDKEEPVDYTTIDMSSLRHISQEYAKTPVIAEEPEDVETPAEPKARANKFRSVSPEDDIEEFDEEEQDDEDEEEPVVYEVAAVQPARTQAVASRMIQARGNVVTIAKRVPPPLPRRSPARVSRLMQNEGAPDTLGVKSPLRQAFSEADLRDEAAEGSIDGAADDVKSTGDISENRLSQISDIGQVLHSTRASTISVADSPKMDAPAIDEELAPRHVAKRVSAAEAKTIAVEAPLVQDVPTPEESPVVEEAAIVDEPTVTEDVVPANHIAPVDEATVSEEADIEGKPTALLPESSDEDGIADSHSGFVATDAVAHAHTDEIDDKAKFEAEATLLEPAPLSGNQFDEEEDAPATSGQHHHIITNGHPTVDITEDSDDAMDGDDEDISDVSDSELMDAEFAIMEPATIKTMRLSQVSGNGDVKPQKLEFRKSRENATEDNVAHVRKSFVDEELDSAMAAFDDMAQVEDSDSHPSTPHNEHTDASDSASINKKHSSSIYTGITDDRWSYDGSSPTTPTSDRPGSMAGDFTDEGTPKKHKRKTQDVAPVEHMEPLEPVDSHNGDTTPTAVTVV